MRPMAQYDVAVVGRRAGRHRDGLRAGRRGACGRCSSTGPTPGRATDAGAGILSPETTKRDDPDWVALVRAAGEHYEQLVPAARRRHRLGAVRHPAARDARRATCPRGSGSPSGRPARPRSAPTRRARWCPCSATSCARCIIPRPARVDGRLMCAALRRAAVERARRRGARRVGRRRARAPGRRRRHRGRRVDRHGRASSSASTLPVGPLRGQIIHLGVDGHDTGAWPIVQPVFGYYMVPWADARVAVGATVEDAGFAADVTAGGVHEVLRETLRVMPGLARATLREVRVGLRPVSVDDMPILGALPGVPTCSSPPATAPTACCSARSPARSSPTSCAAATPALDLAPVQRRRGSRRSISARA